MVMHAKCSAYISIHLRDPIDPVAMRSVQSLIENSLGDTTVYLIFGFCRHCAFVRRLHVEIQRIVVERRATVIQCI